jgi:hypothetical protein
MQLGWDSDCPEGMMPSILRFAASRMLRLLAVAGFGLSLGACTKCDIPSWQHSDAGGAPLACHSDAPTAQ